jgi:magnesium-transporting ATPase (P-type)
MSRLETFAIISAFLHGRTISMENIGRTVTDSFERVNDYVRSDKPRSILHRIGSGIVQMVGLLMRLVLILIAICLAPVLFAGIVTVFALIMAATGILISVPAFVYNAFPYINWELVASSSGMAVGLAVCLLLVVCIPFIGLLQLIFQGLKIWGPMSTTAKVVWVILWFVALGAGIILFIQAPYLNYPYHFLL